MKLEEVIEIKEFINRRFPYDNMWMCQNCYWFSRILVDRFPQLDIYYLPICGHFMAGDGEIFYDWIGTKTKDITLEEKPIKLSVIRTKDPVWYSRLMRDCMK